MNAAQPKLPPAPPPEIKWSEWTEEALAKAMRKDKAATGRKLPKLSADFCPDAPRPEAVEIRAALYDYAKTRLEGFYYREALAALPQYNSNRLRNAIRVLKQQGRLRIVDGTAHKWVVV